jgi:hypothetical protein
MADRFPSLEEFDSGGKLTDFSSSCPGDYNCFNTDNFAAQQSPSGTPGFETAAGDDFLSREKALLGDDADQFASSNDNAAFVEDDDEDLLGGGGGGGGNEEVMEFESSFPAIDTQNEVRLRRSSALQSKL